MALLGRMIETVTDCFAVNCVELRRKFATEAFREGNEASVEGLGINGTEDSSESVIAGHAVGELEEFSQPGFLVFRESLHVFEALALADDGSQGDEQNLTKEVLLVSPGSCVT